MESSGGSPTKRHSQIRSPITTSNGGPDGGGGGSGERDDSTDRSAWMWHEIEVS